MKVNINKKKPIIETQPIVFHRSCSFTLFENTLTEKKKCLILCYIKEKPDI